MQPQQKCCSYVNTQVVSHRTTDAAGCCSSWQTVPTAGGRKLFSLTKCSQGLLGGFAQVALSFHQGEAVPPFHSLGQWPSKSTSQQTGDLTQESQGLNFPALSTRTHLSRKYSIFLFSVLTPNPEPVQPRSFFEPTIYFCSYFHCKTYSGAFLVAFSP